MNKTWFFDRYGTASLLLLENGRFVNQYGRNIGYIFENKIYNYQGEHRGWIENGVIRDVNGLCAAFCRGASDSPGPIFPIPQIPPIPAIPQIPPIPSIRHIPNIKPIKYFGWSPFKPEDLFT